MSKVLIYQHLKRTSLKVSIFYIIFNRNNNRGKAQTCFIFSEQIFYGRDTSGWVCI